MMNRIEEALKDIRQGRMLVVVDDEARENEGDLVMAAEKVTPHAVNFMARYGRGLICVPMPGARLDALYLGNMVNENTESLRTAFTVSVDARQGVTTGISAHDRAHTVKILVNDKSRPQDLVKPGHIFPLRAREGGVLVRAGHTEAAIDLARLAGLTPAGVICEIMHDDGTMARMPELKRFAKRHGLKIITIADLIRFRRQKEKLIERVAQTNIQTRWGAFRLLAYESTDEHGPHLALIKGEPKREVKGKIPLVRVHSECLTGDVFGSLRCDCGEQLHLALQMIEKHGLGVLLYMRQEGRGIGLVNKLKAYHLQQQSGLDTVEANERLGFAPDLRDYGTGAQILADLGLKRIALLTNNPRKIVGLEGYGLQIAKRVPLQVKYSKYNIKYIKTKINKLGHILKI
ncbi:bifunctional 3,4-dihydroxy-2-butanone-4-phosphate synthase/GTP cyclohydrolase II [candidate division FCPU426 bacterium]|nr:bifunctional 3,4-dihydroxy-2-butanone-4-phosphate synthase/GTP cyclohydrolase II [candidate division FCPU426 bacterium]